MQRPVAIKTFEGLGIQVFADAAKTQFRNVMGIFTDVAAKWGQLAPEIQDGFVKAADDAGLYSEELAAAIGSQEQWNDLQQRDISQAAAGVYRRNYFIGMIERLTGAQKVLNNMTDAAGYSVAENERTMDTLEKKYLSLQAAAQQLAVSLGDSGLTGTLKLMVDAGTGVLQVVEKLPKPVQDGVLAFTAMFVVLKTGQQALKLFGITAGTTAVASKVAAGAMGEMAAAATATAAATNTATAASKTFMTVNTWLLVISAAAAAISVLVGAIGRYNEEQKLLVENTKKNIQSLSDEKDGLKELSSEYETLKAKQDSLTATADEKLRLLEVQKELVDAFGVSITGINSEGKAYSDSVVAIKLRVKALEDEIAAKQKLLEIAVQAKDTEDVKKLHVELDAKDAYSDEIVKLQTAIDQGGKYYSSKLQNWGYMGMHGVSGQSAKDLLAQLVNDAKDTNDTIQNLSKDRQQVLQNDATVIIKQIEDNGAKVSDAAKAYISEFANALGGQGVNIDTQKKALQVFIDQMNSSDFDEAVARYNNFKFKGDTAGVDRSAAEIKKFTDALIRLHPELESAALAIESAFGDSSTLNNSNAVTDFTSNIEGMRQVVKTAFDDLETASKSLSSAYEEMSSNNELSVETAMNLLETYPQLADAMTIENGHIKLNKQALEDLWQIEKDRHIKKLEDTKKGLEVQKDALLKTLDVNEKEGRSIVNLMELEQAKVDQRQELAGQTRDYAQSQIDTLLKQKQDAESKGQFFNQGFQLDFWSGALDQFSKKATVDTSVALEKLKEAQGLVDEIGALKKEIDIYSTVGLDTYKGKAGSKQNEALQKALSLLEHEKNMAKESQKSIKQEIADLNKINSLYAKTPEERMNMAERIYSAEKRLMDKRLQDSVNWINEKKSLDQLSADEEIAAWNRVLTNQKDNIEARKEATVNLYKLQKELREKDIEDYKDKLKEQQDALKDAYDERIDQIEGVAQKVKDTQEEEIRRIEEREKRLSRDEDKHDYENEQHDLNDKRLELDKEHDKKLAELQKNRKYHELRTGEEHRKAIEDIDKQIAEETASYNKSIYELNNDIAESAHDREIELRKQELDDEKEAAQEKIRIAEETAKEEKIVWENSYKVLEGLFDTHNIEIVAKAAASSKEAYQQWVDNYLVPMQEALKKGDVSGFNKATTEAEASIEKMQTYQNASSILEMKKQYEIGGDKSAADRAKAYYDELEKLSPGVADQLHNMNYKQTEEYLKRLPKMHSGGETLSYGAVYMKPGELTFPPSLSTDLKTLIAVSSGITGKTRAGDSYSSTDNRKSVKFDNLLKVENMHMEDEVDASILSRELKKVLTSMV